MADLTQQAKVVALTDIRHDGVDYCADDELTLSLAQIKPLLEVGVVKASDNVLNALKSAEAGDTEQPSEQQIATDVEEV